MALDVLLKYLFLFYFVSCVGDFAIVSYFIVVCPLIINLEFYSFFSICCHFSVHSFPSLSNFNYLENSDVWKFFLQECHLNETLGELLDKALSPINRMMAEDY